MQPNLFQSLADEKIVPVNLDSLPRGVWMGEKFLKDQYSVTDLTHFKCDPNGWGGIPRYMIPFNQNK